ncbi:MAG TPA: FHA domain-containing protein [Acidobacteriota bacterium]|nr:FHA domain-containing protein [Acidobacteriota bacterium]
MDSTRPKQESRAWLVQLREGSEEGARHALRGESLRIGRDPSCDIVPEGHRSRVVSARHAEIRRGKRGSFRLVDLDSTNGTFIAAKRIKDARLEEGDVITLGPEGPRFRFHSGPMPASTPERTVILDRREMQASADSPPDEGTLPSAVGAESDSQGRSRRRKRKSVDELAEEAVLQARLARSQGQEEGQTIVFMRDALQQAVSHTKQRWKLVAGGLAAALLAMSGYAWWAAQDVRRQKQDLDYHIRQIEADLADASDPQRLRELSRRLEQYQTQAEALQDSIFFQLGSKDEETDFIEDQLRLLLRDFGAEVYSLPPTFVESVKESIRHFQENDRGSIEQVLIDRRQEFQRIRSTLTEENLPADLAYMVVVESGFRKGSYSPRGAAGPWQMVPVTARAFGLTVDDQVDERMDMVKATRAAAQYIRHLILEFGTGSSIMLALAAYNSGQTRVKRIIREKVDDPLRQRNFWYLYRIKALPRETRNYVPKVMAAILIGRNPERFGFAPALTD